MGKYVLFKDIDERLSISFDGVMDIDAEIDNLCSSFDMMKGVHSKEEAHNSLQYSNNLGFYYLRDDFSWIRASFDRYEKYLKYLSLEIFEDTYVAYWLMKDFLEFQPRDMESIRVNSNVLAAKIIAIDGIVEKVVDRHTAPRDDMSEHSVCSNLGWEETREEYDDF